MQNKASERDKLESQLIDDMASFSNDPYGWVLYSFDWGKGELEKFSGPDEWQAAELKELTRKLQDPGANAGVIIREAIASGHGIGKSAFVAWLILWALSTFEDTMGVVTANTETQLKTKTWANVAKWYRLCIVKHWFHLTATALYSVQSEHEKTWRIDMVPWSESNTEAFAGLHNQGKRIILIYDEASAIPDVIWEVSEGALTDTDTQIIWAVFGNPTRNTGRFRECFSRYSHRWHTQQIDSRSSMLTDKKQIQEWVDDYGIDSDFVKVRVRGMFPSMSARQFFSLADVDAAFGKHLRPEQYNFAPKILTCDPAWEGDDMLEIGLRQGLAFKLIRTIPKNDNDIEIANIIAQLEDDERADAVFIDAGYGTGIVSAGRTWGREWMLVWFAGESTNPGMLNKRAQMADELKQWLKQGGAIPAINELRDDILSPETVPRTDGKVQLESKKEIKKRLGRSPGKLDSLLLSFAFPVHVKTRGATNNRADTDYDPLSSHNNSAVTEYSTWN